MTKVNYTLNSQDKITYLESKGHAGYDELGKDIVCASISTSLIISLNLLDKIGLIDKVKYTMKEGLVTIEVLDVEEEMIQQVLENLLNTLRDLEDEYPKNIKINCRRLAR